jgi:hypothetical protein
LLVKPPFRQNSQIEFRIEWLSRPGGCL